MSQKTIIIIEKILKFLPDATSIITKKLPEKSNKTKFKIGYFGSIYKSRGIELIFKLAKLDKKKPVLYLWWYKI